jgi:polysaccharide chain length determinant protein (PEP-CTERM system associated)
MDNEGGTGTLVSQAAAIWRRRKWLALLVFAAALTAVVALAVSLPDVYRGSATVLVERHGVPESFVKSAVTSELETRLQTVNQKILSRSNLAALADRLQLYPELRARGSAQAVADRMRRDVTLELKSVERRGFQEPAMVAFTIGYRGRDPGTVATVANTLASAYIEENRASREQQATATASLLKSQLDETKTRLEAQERRIGEFRQRHPGAVPQQAMANAVALERLHAELRATLGGQERAAERRQAALQQMAEVAASPTGSAADGPAAVLATKRAELARLRTEYTERYPDVVRLRQEIELLERQPAVRPGAPTPRATLGAATPATHRLQQAVTQAETDAARLRDEEVRLRRAIADYQRRVDDAPRLEQELGQLSRDYEATREVYRSLLGRYEEALIGQTMEAQRGGEVFRLVDTAVPPERPAAPDRMLLVLIGTLAAAGLAVGVAFLADQLDSSFHSAEALRSFTAVPVVAAIPVIDTEGDRRARARRFRLAAAGALVGLLAIAGIAHVVARDNDGLVTMMVRKAS